MEQRFDIASNLPTDTIVSVFVLIFLAGFVLFSLLVIKQVGVMCSVVDRPSNAILKVIARLQLLAGIIVMVLAILVAFI